MNNQSHISNDYSYLLSEERFKLPYSEVIAKLEELKNDGLIDDTQFNKVADEDILLEIKYKTYKKCIRKVITGIIFIILGVLITFSLQFIFIVIGLFTLLSSIAGILSNRVTENQKEYIRKKSSI